MIGAGALDKRITIQQRNLASPQKTASGAPSESWGDVVSVWARIEPLTGREFLEAQSMQSVISVRIKIRNRSGVTAGMRVVRSTTVYNIEAVLPPKQADDDLVLMCSQGASNG